jgi:PST family polysaccharide transporter
VGSAVRRGVVWSVASLALSKLLGLVSVLVLARLLAPDEFGTLGAVVTFLAFMQLGSDLGMQAAVVYEQEQGVTRRVHVAFTVNAVLALGLTVLGVVLAGPVAAFFGAPDAEWLFRLGMLNLLLAALANVHDGLLLRDMEFSRRIVPQVGQAVVQAAVSVGLAFAGAGAAALVVGLLAGTAAWVALQWRITGFRPRVIFDKAIARTMIGYGGAAATLEILAVVSARADAIVVGHVLGTVALGVYTIAYRLPELAISNLTWTVSGVAFPALSRRRGRGMIDATLALIGILALYTVPVGVLLAVLADPLVHLLLGDRWEGAIPVLRAVAVTAAIHTVIFPLGDAGKAQGRQWGMVGLHLLHIPVLYLGMTLAADAGLAAVAWAGTGASVLYVATFLLWAHRFVGVPAGGVARALWPPFVAAAGVGVGAGAARAVLSDAPAIVELLVAVPLAAAGAVLALRLVNPGRLTGAAADLGLDGALERLPWRRSPAAP